ncbi:NYN domain-containing protein [Rathayibacter sp. YIM 133350]|uniref:NYN domain-containing protein n=1 Tax=Rathayibacter sp. YIM 133350 TaxID=3131992 RepID=UPI00307D12D9
MTSLPAKPHRPADRLIVYIDGFNLYHGMHDASGRSALWIDFVQLAKLLRPRSRLVAVKYFTAPVLDDPGGLSRQAHHQAALLAKYPTLFEVTQGRYQTKTVTCFKCNAPRQVREEKETDVNIAVSLVSDAAQRHMDAALLISADSDLAPAVRMAKNLQQNTFIAAAFPPERYSNELKALMPASFQIGRDRVRKAQLPPSFSVGSTTFNKPTKWA